MKKIKYRNIQKYKYQLLEPCVVETGVYPAKGVVTRFLTLVRNGNLTIYSGYAWDGPSGPTIDTKSFMRGSLVHDALYQLIRDGHLDYDFKDVADDLLRQICLEDGMYKWRAWYVHKAVRVFGWFAIKPIF